MDDTGKEKPAARGAARTAGFRGESLCAMMILFAAPAAVASYPMAVAMGADGQLAGQLVCTTTVLSVFTIFAWTFVLRTLGMM